MLFIISDVSYCTCKAFSRENPINFLKVWRTQISMAAGIQYKELHYFTVNHSSISTLVCGSQKCNNLLGEKSVFLGGNLVLEVEHPAGISRSNP